MHLKNQTILVTSNEPWGDIWYSKQNYAYELSKSNRVFFVNPPTGYSIRNLLSARVRQTEYSPTLQILHYENRLPIRNNFLNRLNDYLVCRSLKRHLARQGVVDFILWSFDPLRIYNHRHLGAKLGIYHCVDYYYFKFLGETELCKNSDLLFATSQKFLDEYHRFSAPKHVVPHGISMEEFSLDEQTLAELDVPCQDYGLYVGVIDKRLDYSLLEQAIERFPAQPFLFVGPLRLPNHPAARRIFEDRRYPNVFAIGPRHFKTLKYYIARAKFCISFMDMTYHANTVHHHKTLVYLTQGKPVFGPAFTEYSHLNNIMYLENSPEEILGHLSRFLREGEDPGLKTERIEHALQYTFENILGQASQIIAEHTTKRLSANV